MTADLVSTVREATRELIVGLSLELVDIEVNRERGSLFLRMYIDRTGGVTADDCASASELIGRVLERENVMRGAYILEVMSPGLDRALKYPEDFARSAGKKVVVKLEAAVNGRYRHEGRIICSDDDWFTMDANGTAMRFGY